MRCHSNTQGAEMPHKEDNMDLFAGTTIQAIISNPVVIYFIGFTSMVAVACTTIIISILND